MPKGRISKETRLRMSQQMKARWAEIKAKSFTPVLPDRPLTRKEEYGQAVLEVIGDKIGPSTLRQMLRSFTK